VDDGGVVRVVSRIGIAIGSLVIAYLAVSLVADALLAQWAQANPFLITVISVVLGGLVYVDIMRREHRRDARETARLV
jgi:uncharacterized membrane protein YhhN